KAASGDDQSPVHKKFAERQRRVEHQPPFRRAIENLHAEAWARAVAERLGDPLGGLDLEAAAANKFPQICRERRAHSSPVAPVIPFVRLRNVQRRFQVQIFAAGHPRPKPLTEPSWFGPILATMSAAVPLSRILR